MKTKWLLISLLGGLALVLGTGLALGGWSDNVQAQAPDAPAVGPGWLFATVDDDGDPDSTSSSLVLDGDDTPHIAYHVVTGDAVRYAVLDGAAWLSETVATSAVGPILAFDSSGDPHIAFTQRGPNAIYAQKAGASWVTDTVELTAAAGDIALDGADNPRILQWRMGPPMVGGGLKYSVWTGGWDIQVVEAEWWKDGAGFSLALDGSDEPHVAYNVVDFDAVYYAVLSGTTWIRETVVLSGLMPSLVLDSAGDSHMVYTHRGPWAEYAYQVASGWVTERIDSEPSVSPALALDEFDNPHVAYCDPRPRPVGDGLKYAYRTASGWVIEEIEWIACADPQLALDSLGNPHISFYDLENDRIRYAHWATEQVTGTIGTGGGTIASESDNTILNIPQDTFTATVVVTHTPLFVGSTPPAADLLGIGHAFDVTAVFEGSGGEAQPAPGETVTVTVGYTDEERGVVVEDTLALYSWDGNDWVLEPTSQVDTGANTVTATPGHFSIWAVLGDTHRVFLPLVQQSY